ncbi:MAG: branched-chain amino acid ABC transporter permease, partial [Actinomycetota bacterium]
MLWARVMRGRHMRQRDTDPLHDPDPGLRPDGPLGGAVFQPFGGTGRGLYLLGEGGLYIARFTIAGFDIPPDRFVPGRYYVIAGAFLGSTLILWRISRSPFGTALRAIRDNDTRALCIGLPVRTYRRAAFVRSGVFTGLGGALYGELTRQITVEQLHWLLSAQLILMTVRGGTRTSWAQLPGAFAF